MLKLDPGNLDRKLKELEKEGLLASEKKGNLKYYFLNSHYPLLHEFEKWYNMKYGLEKRLAETFKKLKGLKEAYVFGSYARGNFGSQSDIDILLIGNHSSIEAQKLVSGIQNDLKRELNLIDMTEKEFTKRKKNKDELIVEIFKNKNIKII